MQVNENKLKELLGKVDIESIDSACPDDQDECPVNGGCAECWMNYFQRSEPMPTEAPAMIIKCKCCGKRPDEIEEYVDCAREEKMTPDELAQTDGTFNKITGEFYCTNCYISIGMPLGTA